MFILRLVYSQALCGSRPSALAVEIKCHCFHLCWVCLCVFISLKNTACTCRLQRLNTKESFTGTNPPLNISFTRTSESCSQVSPVSRPSHFLWEGGRKPRRTWREIRRLKQPKFKTSCCEETATVLTNPLAEVACCCRYSHVSLLWLKETNVWKWRVQHWHRAQS